MKKLLSLILCAALLCALCACGGQTPAVQDAGDPEDNTLPVSEDGTGTPEDSAKPDESQEELPAEDGEDDENTESPEAPPAPTEAAEEPPAAQSGEQSAAQPKEQPKEQPAAQPKDQTPAQTQPKPEPAPEPAPVQEPAPAEEVDRKAVAQGLVGRPVSELYAAIGRPISSDYAPSCLIDGEDGELIYDGFTVYTEKGANYETVYAVF